MKRPFTAAFRHLSLLLCAAAWLAAVLLAAVGVWVLVGLAVMACAYLLGRVDARRAADADVEHRVRGQVRPLALQLAEAERALADRAEVDHAAARGRLWPGNGVGHRSPAGWDAPPSRSSFPDPTRDTPSVPI